MIETIDKRIPFFGVVEDVKDPEENGRYRVRVYGYNTQNKTILPTDMLKWFSLSVSNSAGFNGLGWSPTGLLVGSFVEGYYIDSDLQTGIITGALTGSPYGSNDVSGLALTSNAALRNPYTAPGPILQSEQGDQPIIDPETGKELDTEELLPEDEQGDQISKEQYEEEKLKKEEKDREAEENKTEDERAREAALSKDEQEQQEMEERFVVPPRTRADYEALLVSRKIQVFLQLIMYAEGTDKYPNPYKVIFSGQTFDSYKWHPNRLITSGKYKSTAAGAFQFIIGTWNAHAKVLGLTNFSPKNQQIAALYEGRAAIPHILNCEWERAIRAVNTNWASFPGSPYGQPVKTMSQMLAFINNRGGFTCDGVKYEPGPDLPIGDRIQQSGVKTGTGEQLTFPNMDSYESGGSVYPHNQVFATESGHFMEWDSTPGRERIKIFHRTGTYDEMLPDGSIMHRVSGNRYEINLADSTMVVQGDMNVQVNGQYKLSASGGAVITAPNIILNSPDITSTGEHIANDFIAGGVSLGKHTHGGVERGSSNTNPPQPYEPDLEQLSFSSGPMIDESIPAKSAAQHFVEGTITQEQYEEAQTIEDQEPEELEENNVEPIETECGEIPMDKNGNIDYNAYISKTVKLGDVSINGKAPSSHRIVDNVGLTKAEIICNLKALSENIIDKCKVRFDIQINSGFRAAKGNSQHNRGQAADLRLVGKRTDGDAHYDLAKWVAENCVFDQLILEKGSSGGYWVHVSYNRTGRNRKQILSTWVGRTKYLSGLRKL